EVGDVDALAPARFVVARDDRRRAADPFARLAGPVRGRSDRFTTHRRLGRLGRLLLFLGIEAAGDGVGQRIADLADRNIAVDARLARSVADRVAQHAAQYAAPDAAARLALGAAAIV